MKGRTQYCPGGGYVPEVYTFVFFHLAKNISYPDGHQAGFKDPLALPLLENISTYAVTQGGYEFTTWLIVQVEIF